MKFFMTDKRFRMEVDEALRKNNQQDEIWELQGTCENLRSEIAWLKDRVHELERISMNKITVTPYWSDKTVEVQKTDITC